MGGSDAGVIGVGPGVGGVGSRTQEKMTPNVRKNTAADPTKMKGRRLT